MNVLVVCGVGWLLLTDAACAAYSPLSGRGNIFLGVVTCSTSPARLWLCHLFLAFPHHSLLLLPSLMACFGPPDVSDPPSAVCSEGLVSPTSVGHQPKGHESNRRGCLPAVSSNVWSLADGSSSYRGNPANLL